MYFWDKCRPIERRKTSSGSGWDPDRIIMRNDLQSRRFRRIERARHSNSYCQPTKKRLNSFKKKQGVIWKKNTLTQAVNQRKGGTLPKGKFITSMVTQVFNQPKGETFYRLILVTDWERWVLISRPFSPSVNCISRMNPENCFTYFRRTLPIWSVTSLIYGRKTTNLWSSIFMVFGV